MHLHLGEKRIMLKLNLILALHFVFGDSQDPAIMFKGEKGATGDPGLRGQIGDPGKNGLSFRKMKSGQEKMERLDTKGQKGDKGCKDHLDDKEIQANTARMENVAESERMDYVAIKGNLALMALQDSWCFCIRNDLKTYFRREMIKVKKTVKMIINEICAQESAHNYYKIQKKI